MGYTLVLGGARSGKSAFAQREAENAAARSGAVPTAIVTAQVYDDEMADRVAKHQAERGENWHTIEAPVELPAAIASLKSDDVAVVDCMTLWLTNIMLGDHDIKAFTDQLLEALERSPAQIWLVSNEVGWGIVPDNALARRFRDEAGRLNQRLAAKADSAVLIVAGMKLDLSHA